VWDRQDKSYLGQTLAVNILVGTLLCAPTWYTAYIFNPVGAECMPLLWVLMQIAAGL